MKDWPSPSSRLSHRKVLGSNQPGLFLILTDQSGAMAGTSLSGRTKAEEAAYAVNRVIDAILTSCEDGEKDWCTLGVIGYGQKVAPIIGGRISEFAENVVGTAERDGIKYRVWITPEHKNGTPMAEALKIAYDLAKEWVEDERNRDSFPPVIINITGGAPDDLDVSGQASESEAWAKSLRSLRTTDGRALLFNILISGEGLGSAELLFPQSEDGLQCSEAKLCFRMSSELPTRLRNRLHYLGDLHAIKTRVRTMVSNTEAQWPIKLLRWGTDWPD